MLELILRGLEKLSSYVVRFLRWASVVGINTHAASRRDIIHLTGQNAELHGEPDEALRWLDELEKRKQYEMPIIDDELEGKIAKFLNENQHLERKFVMPDLRFDFKRNPDDAMPFDPRYYRCEMCDRSGVKLWRSSQEHPLNQVHLLCAFCVGDEMGMSLRGSRDLGKNVTKFSTLFYYFPAIPMLSGQTYLSVTSIRHASDDNILVNTWLKLAD